MQGKHSLKPSEPSPHNSPTPTPQASPFPPPKPRPPASPFSSRLLSSPQSNLALKAHLASSFSYCKARSRWCSQSIKLRDQIPHLGQIPHVQAPKKPQSPSSASNNPLRLHALKQERPLLPCYPASPVVLSAICQSTIRIS